MTVSDRLVFALAFSFIAAEITTSFLGEKLNVSAVLFALALMASCATQPKRSHVAEIPEAPRHPDTALLDHIEVTESNLFFNEQYDGGTWGIVDSDNKLIAAGHTARDAIAAAQMRSGASHV